MAAERVLVFVPMYNCATQIERVLRRFDDRSKALVDTILVVDNQSTDGGADVAGRIVAEMTGVHAKVLRNDQNYGLGGSHKVAFEYALTHGFDHVAVLHGDDQGSFADLVPELEHGAHHTVDALLGARFLPGSRLDGYSAFRTVSNRLLNAVFSIATRRRLHDLGSGLNLYRVDLLRDRFYHAFPDDLTFNYCMILAHVRLGHRFVFFPIRWREEDQISNVKLLAQTRRVFGLLARFVVGPGRFVQAEHRTVPREAYTARVVAENS